MKLPLFIQSQEQEDDYPVCTIDAMRIVTEFVGAYAKISLQTVEELVTMRHRREDPDFVATDILLDRGEEFGDCEHIEDLLASALDIEKITRRFKGNQILVHTAERTAFEKKFPTYQAHGFLLWTNDHPKLLGKVVMTYAANTNQVDGGLIMAYHVDSHSYGFSAAHTELYTRIMSFDSNTTVGYSMQQRRQRKASYN